MSLPPYHLGPLLDLPHDDGERILVQFETGFAATNLLHHSAHVMERLVSQGWEIHAPLFHVEDAVVVPKAWQDVVIYNLGDHHYGIPVTDDPNALIEKMVQNVTARDGVKRAVYLPLIDLWTGSTGWFDEPFGDKLREAASVILSRDSGVSLVIASALVQRSLPSWAEFDVSLLARWYGVQVLPRSFAAAH